MQASADRSGGCEMVERRCFEEVIVIDGAASSPSEALDFRSRRRDYSHLFH